MAFHTMTQITNTKYYDKPQTIVTSKQSVAVEQSWWAVRGVVLAECEGLTECEAPQRQLNKGPQSSLMSQRPTEE